MGPHYLNHFFYPGSVAIIGATEREGSVGQRILINMLEAGFAGSLFPVNPNHETLMGIKAWPDIESVPSQVDLAVIATPAKTVPDLVHKCGEKGIHSIIIITAGFGELGAEGRRLEQEVLDIAHKYSIRLIGPNCLGVISPRGKLNATFGFGKVEPGNLALVSQSGAVCTAILDWAQSEGIGFSSVVSMGDAADIDFGEILDFLAMDQSTTGILLYVEGIKEARRFLSGLKASARLKPVILIKSGRHEAGSKAAMSHTGAIVGGDDVFEAAINRAGVVRVFSIDQLFSAARILANNFTVDNDRLAIITNAGGPGVMSTDRAEDVGITMAKISQTSIDALNQVLPVSWSHANPVDILGDATPDRYKQALDICLQDDNIDGILLILTPQAMTDPTKVAELVIASAAGSKKPVLASWTGGGRVREGRELFSNSSIAHFNTPEMGVDAFSFLAQYSKNQKLLRQTPASLKEKKEPDVEGARLIIERVLGEGRKILTAQEAKAILSAFHIPVTATMIVRSSREAMIAAETIGFPVVLKINMPEFSHKTEIGGVRLGLASVKSVSDNFIEMESLIKEKYPEIREVVMTIEPMYRSYNGRELMVGVIRDPVFGPAMSFGLGGTLVEVLGDKSVALPPLNEYMAAEMISRTRAAKYLRAFRQLPAADIHALTEVLINLSLLVSELPEVIELDINPLIADDRGVMAVDARIRAESSRQLKRYSHMAIHPYPHELTEICQLPDGKTFKIRPIRPEDAVMEKDFVHNLSAKSKYFRYRQELQELTPEMILRFTQIDYEREMAFVAVTETEPQKELGVGRYILNPDGKTADFALVVADDAQNMGIGNRIMRALMKAAISQGIHIFASEILASNKPMQSLVTRLGFSLEEIPGNTEALLAVRNLTED